MEGCGALALLISRMDENHTVIRFTMTNPKQELINGILDDISAFDENAEQVDGIEFHIPQLSNENAVGLLEQLNNDGHDTVVTGLSVEVRR